MLQLIDDYLTQLADSFTESPTVWNDIVRLYLLKITRERLLTNQLENNYE